MEFASGFTYISKRKVENVKKRKKAKTALEADPVLEAELERERFDSCEEYSGDKLDKFMGEEEKGLQFDKHKKFAQEVDTNVIRLNLSELESKGNIATGEPTFCIKCRALLNSLSKLKEDEEQKDSQIWDCEFCGFKNKITLEEEEIPSTEKITYILEAPPVVSDVPLQLQGGVEEEKKVMPGEKPADFNDDVSIVFCVDVSGSMDTSQKTMGAPMKYQKSKTHISRLECVKLAIDDQISKMIKEFPNRKVGFVLFENDVVVHGDCIEPPQKIPLKMQNDYNGLLEYASGNASRYMSQNVTVAQENLLSTLKNIQTGGLTALGPGLLASVAIAGRGAPGSKVVICTDGCANRGLGSVESKSQKIQEQAADFYERVGVYATQKGVVISIISIVEQECKLEMLSPIANLTGGDILKVDPQNLSDDFSFFLSEKVIATNVEVRVKIHKGLSFRNERADNISEENTMLTRVIGNVTAESELTFEYCLQRPEILEAMEDFDFDTMTHIPFQAQIKYKNLEGLKCIKEITMQQQVTHEKEEAKKEMNVNVLKVNAVQKTSKLAKEGKYREAQANAVHWGEIMKGKADDFDDYKSEVTPIYAALQEQQMALPPPPAAPYGGAGLFGSAAPGAAPPMPASKSKVQQKNFTLDKLSSEMNQAFKASSKTANRKKMK
jgi:hypothetical protein